MWIDLPYGCESVRVKVPDQAQVATFQESPGVKDVRVEIRRALNNPIESPSLPRLARGKPDAVVVINDITRPAPSEIMLEELLRDLAEAGIQEDAVTVIIACGYHRPNTEEEIQGMVGKDLASRLRILNHDCTDTENLTFVGETDRGRPVWVNSLITKAAVKILTGIITPHHAAGYGGGRKSVMPGVAGFNTLQQHHSFPIRPYEPASGRMKGNIFHEEAVKVARMVGVDFILNVVKTTDGQVVKAVAGELEVAHEHGVAVCEKSWRLELPHRYDVAIVTPGGYPRDINLHQSQKAISSAEMVIEQDGVIVLLAECRDGVGKFADWLRDAESPREVIERFRREGFTREHSSKAFMCARALEKYTVIVSSSGIGKDELEQMFFRSAPSPQAAIEEALKLKGLGSKVLVLPHAASCVPTVTM